MLAFLAAGPSVCVARRLAQLVMVMMTMMMMGMVMHHSQTRDSRSCQSMGSP